MTLTVSSSSSSSSLPSASWCLMIPPPIVACGKKKHVSNEEIIAYRTNLPKMAFNKLPDVVLDTIFKMVGGMHTYTYRVCRSMRHDYDMTSWLFSLPHNVNIAKWTRDKNVRAQFEIFLKTPDPIRTSVAMMLPVAILPVTMLWDKAPTFNPDDNNPIPFIAWLYAGKPLEREMDAWACERVANRIHWLTNLMAVADKGVIDPTISDEQVIEEARKQQTESFSPAVSYNQQLTAKNFSSDPITIRSLMKIIMHVYEKMSRHQCEANEVLLKLCFTLIESDQLQLLDSIPEIKRKAAGVCYAAILEGCEARLANPEVFKLIQSQGFLTPNCLENANFQTVVLSYINAYLPLSGLGFCADAIAALLLENKDKIINLYIDIPGLSDNDVVTLLPKVEKLTATMKRRLSEPLQLQATIKELTIRGNFPLIGIMPHLKKLTLVRNNETSFTIIAPNLTDLNLRACETLQSFPTLHAHENLRALTIAEQEVPEIELPALEILTVEPGMPFLERWRTCFPKLKTVLNNQKDPLWKRAEAYESKDADKSQPRT